MEIDDILALNTERYDALMATYDPKTGEGLPGRVRIEIPEFHIPVQYVPRGLLQEQFVKDLLKAGSVTEFAELKGSTPREIAKTFFRLRRKYDFELWAYDCFPIVAKRENWRKSYKRFR